jgi:hypothetical protein
MGYNTSFLLEIMPVEAEYKLCEHEFEEHYNYCPFCGLPAKPTPFEVGEAIEKYTKQNFHGYDLELERETDPQKWYTYEDDMRKLSKKFPKVLFILSGSGEDSEDLWREYYLNGKRQRSKAVITYQEFDKKLLD